MYIKKLLLFALLILSFSSFAQDQVKGFIKNSEGEPLSQANVLVKNLNIVTTTDINGFFKLPNICCGEITIEISFVGYKTKQTSFNLTPANNVEVLVTLEEEYLHVSELTVTGTRAGEKDPFSFTNVNSKDIEKNNLGQDIPYLLDQTPSVVVNSDAGAGIGYTGIRIRGTDPTRINITINGIPINDSESQNVWWVNMPDFASSVDNIQIQRGVGTSVNGAGAFGASINMQTNKLKTNPFAVISNSFGSFNSRRHSIQFGSGMIKNHWNFEGRLSQIKSDGFIDRASSNLRSYYFSGAYVNDKTIIQANIFSGHERTYQAWGGVPLQYVDTNRTYNPYTYENEIDNYTQTHYQLHWNQEINKNFSSSLSLHYTRGFGYFEQYRNSENLADYNITPTDSNNTESDLIRQRWLDNHFYGAVYGLHYNTDDSRLRITFGGAVNQYDGAHFGKVIWARNAGDSEIGHEYYNNVGKKTEISNYLKMNYEFVKNWFLYADFQHRFLSYEFLGFNNDLENVAQSVNLNFFNPKLGFSYFPSNHQKVYASMAIAHREPNRNDFTESTPSSRPKAERLYDLEMGYSYNRKNLSLEANLYFMYYYNQLVLTGQINDVGAYMRTNVPESYRAGIELVASWRPIKNLSISANSTFSRNKISNYTEYVDNWDTWGQEALEYKNTDLAFSPNIIVGSEINYDIINHSFGEKQDKKHILSAAWISKYISKQYIDNSQNENRSLPSYWVNDLGIRYQLKKTFFEELSLNFMLRNFANAMYSNNAWVYRFRSPTYDPRPDDPYTGLENGDYYHMIGLFPQAGINFMIGLDLKF
jgi:iron complex outermembrane recepter protein